jgi:Bacterial Ig-like domain (group 3)
MNVATRLSILYAAVLLCPALLASAAQPSESTESVIALDPASNTAGTAVSALSTARSDDAMFANAPPNFRSFAAAHVGENTSPQQLTLRFSAATTLTAIDLSKDFQLVSGGTCAEEQSYAAGASCTLLVRFTPQGAGPRLGKLTVSNTAMAQPFAFGVGGNGYAPIVSFTPAIITTVAGTYPSSVGLLSGARSLAVDGSDSLYVADSGNKVIRYLDSGGTFKTLTTTATAPTGIAVDNFGEVYFDETTANTMHEIYEYGPVFQLNGSGTGACLVATPCNLDTEAVGSPGMMSMDHNNHLFFVDSYYGAAMATVLPSPAKVFFVNDPFPYQTNPQGAVAADSNDYIYSSWSNGGVCAIIQQSLYDAENLDDNYTKIAGGRVCGFSGDGGQAGNAEIGASIGQIAFDSAGNLYFSDTANQRVRRIDYVTGNISTIAGSGSAGYIGDHGAATIAQLSAPSGVAVDSQGQVFIISATKSGGSAQVIRKVGPNGFLSFGNRAKGSTGSANIVTVSNTGNSALTITNVALTGTNPGDFRIDPNTTSCLLTPGSTLYSGQSCLIGVATSPTGAGSRTANLVLLDNSVSGSNTVQLTVNGTLPTPSLTITSPATGTSVASGVPVKFAVSVTSTSSPVPTGTVQFKVDGVADGAPVTLSSGTASVNVTETVTGTHTLSATYSGDANYNPTGPVSRTYTVTAAAKPSTTKLISSMNPAESCQHVDFTVTVSGTSGSTPSGTVSLKNGSTVLGSASLSKGTATLWTSMPRLAVGTNLLTAHYAGDAKNAASISAVLSQVVSSQRSACELTH